MQTAYPQLDALPEFLNSKDLVAIGLYPSAAAVYLARMRGRSPDFIKLGRRIVYPKQCVASFIEKSFRAGNIPYPQRLDEEEAQC